ncbi:neprilysin-1-like [Haemaphysalis longicornis]
MTIPQEAALFRSPCPVPADGEGDDSSTETLNVGPEPSADLLTTSVVVVSLLAGIAFTLLSLATPLLLSLVSLGCPAPDPRCFDYVREMALTIGHPEQGGDPCEDFFGYMCSNFEDLHPNRFSFTSLLESRLSAYRDHIIDEHETELSDEIGTSVVTAYRRCIDEYRQNLDSPIALRALVRSAGLQWSRKPPAHSHGDMLLILLRLSLEHGVPVLLRASLGPPLRLTAHSRAVLNVDLHLPPPPAAMGERTPQVIEGSLRWVAHNGTAISRFQRAAMATFETLRRLQNRLASAPRWLGGLRYVSFGQVPKELIPFVTAGQFTKLANAALPTKENKDYFEPTDVLVTATPTLVSALCAFVHSTPEPSVETLRLVRYLLVESLLPVATGQLADVYGLGRRDAFRLRADACLRDAVALLPRAWEHLFYEDILAQSYHAVDKLALGILKTVPAAYSWMDENTRKSTHERLHRLRVVLGPAVLTTHSELKSQHKYFRPYTPDKGFLSWLLENRAYHLSHRTQNLLASNGTGGQRPEPPTFQDAVPNAVVDPVHQDVLVSPALLFAPFRAEDGRPFTSTVNSAAIGSLVASLIARYLDPVEGAYDFTGQRLDHSWYGGAAEATYAQSLQCIRNRQSAYEGINVTEREAAEVLANTMGLRIALSAFRDGNESKASDSGLLADPALAALMAQLSGGGSDERRPPRLQRERLFFAAFCFQFCGVVLPRGSTGLPLNARCNLPLREMPDFARAFKCANNSAMAAQLACLPH